MARRGIFSGFGSADLIGQILSLRTANSSGIATENPLATSVQEAMRDVFGYGNLPVDGKWGDCSQQAYINAVGEKPSAASLVAAMGLDKFGVSPSAVKVWDKTPYCPSTTQTTPNGYKPPTKGYVEPTMIIARNFGLPDPGVCKAQGRVSNMAEATCECPAGTYENVNTGACEQFESPQTVGPKTASLLATRLKFVAANTATAKRLTDLKISSDAKQTVTPLISSSLLKIVRLQPTTNATLASKLNLSSLLKGGSGSGAGAGSAAGGMGTGTKVALGVVVLGAVGAGVWWWMNRQSSAVPNCGYYRNCGEVGRY